MDPLLLLGHCFWNLRQSSQELIWIWVLWLLSLPSVQRRLQVTSDCSRSWLSLLCIWCASVVPGFSYCPYSILSFHHSLHDYAMEIVSLHGLASLQVADFCCLLLGTLPIVDSFHWCSLSLGQDLCS